MRIRVRIPIQTEEVDEADFGTSFLRAHDVILYVEATSTEVAVEKVTNMLQAQLAHHNGAHDTPSTMMTEVQHARC